MWIGSRARWLRTAALAGLHFGASAALAAGVEAEATERQRLLSAAREVMTKARYCTLVTLGGDGHPQARIVDPLAPGEGLEVWIATRPATRKVGEIRADARVSLLYFDPAGPAYVTLLGRAELVTDPAERVRRWKEEWAPFYKDAHRGDDLVLIRVRPRRLEVVSEGHEILGDPVTWRPRAIDIPPPEPSYSK
jgi:PPOX class probable F420-dependent enzyme